MNTPAELKYARSHEWVKTDGATAEIGISDHAQESLGDLVYVNLPAKGDKVSCGEAFADVESVKAVSDIYSPVTGVVSEVNEQLMDSPELINSDPYGSWLIRVENVTAIGELLDAAAYTKLCEEETD